MNVNVAKRLGLVVVVAAAAAAVALAVVGGTAWFAVAPEMHGVLQPNEQQPPPPQHADVPGDARSGALVAPDGAAAGPEGAAGGPGQDGPAAGDPDVPATGDVGRDPSAPSTSGSYGAGGGYSDGGSSSGGSGASDKNDGAFLPATAKTGTITRVIDGDTMVVDKDVRIRLALVDTPERGEPGYEEASAFTRAKCPAGTAAAYDEDDGQRSGSYGRVVALVWCAGHGHGPQPTASINEQLLEAGHATMDRRFCAASEFGDDEWAQRGGC